MRASNNGNMVTATHTAAAYFRHQKGRLSNPSNTACKSSALCAFPPDGGTPVAMANKMICFLTTSFVSCASVDLKSKVESSLAIFDYTEGTIARILYAYDGIGGRYGEVDLLRNLSTNRADDT